MSRIWSAQQLAIFKHFEFETKRNLVVRARAGTGKTTTIIEAINFAPEQKILLAAFNAEIAKELSAKIAGNPRAEAKTLHGLGFAFLRSAWQGVRVEATNGQRAWDLALAAASTAPDSIVKLIANLHTKVREINPFARNIADVLDVAYRFDLLPDTEEKVWVEAKVAAAALEAVRAAKLRTAEIDFADMIFLPLVHGFVRPWFQLVVVDEAQDMSDSQLKLAVGACKRDGRIIIVGDNRQAIYGFRGADTGSLDRLKGELNAVELGLTITYRCASSIVALAKEIVPDYVSAPTAPLGVISTVGKDAMFAGARAGDFVISRTNAPLVEVCLTLLKQGVRATIRGRDIGKGILALIRKLRAKSPVELIGSLTSWKKAELERAAALGEKGEARTQFVNDQFDLIVALTEGSISLKEIEDRLFNLFSDDNAAGKVICTTVHKIKGQETDRTWLLEGTFQIKGEEASNIRYVAITRAKTQLNWVKGFEKIKKTEE